MKFAAEGVSLLKGGTNDWSFGMALNTRAPQASTMSRLPPQITPKVRSGLGTFPRKAAIKKSRPALERSRPLLSSAIRGRHVDTWEARPSGYVVVRKILMTSNTR